MKGLELSRAYWEKCALPLFRRELPAFLERAAVGLVGEGSECFGFDDEISQDHDWGPGFCLWLPEGEWAEWQDAVEALLARLPDTYEGSLLVWRPPSVWAGSGRCPLRASMAGSSGCRSLLRHGNSGGSCRAVPRGKHEWSCVQ